MNLSCSSRKCPPICLQRLEKWGENNPAIACLHAELMCFSSFPVKPVHDWLNERESYGLRLTRRLVRLQEERERRKLLAIYEGQTWKVICMRSSP
jgi:hypothetical protein